MKFRNDATIVKLSLIKLNYLSNNEVQFYRVHYELVTAEGGISTNKIQLNVYSSIFPSVFPHLLLFEGFLTLI